MVDSAVDEVLVVGAGVTGLTTGVALREAGFDAHIVADHMPEHTTSEVAAAIWYPIGPRPTDRVWQWACASHATLSELAGGRETGVFVTELHQYTSEAEFPWWANDLDGFRVLGGDELPHGRASGFAFRTPRIEPSIYLQYLLHRFRGHGGVVSRTRVSDLEAETAQRRAVVNCTGLGSRKLLDDGELFPVRGQVVLVENPGLRHGVIDVPTGSELTYILPRTREVVLGGTRDEGDWRSEPDDATTQRILASCRAIEPRLVDAGVLGAKVGLRPGRTAVRVELEADSAGIIIHNYGHGMDGYTLSWGCAATVVDLLTAAVEIE